MTVPWKQARGCALTLTERTWLKDCAKAVACRFARAVIVNIGVFRCASMYCLRAEAPDARIVGIDTKPCDVPIHEGLRAEFIIADSRECHEGFVGPVHLLFVDGDHHYAVVEADVANWVPKIVPEGIVAFHDYAPLPRDLQKNPHLEGVRRAVSEWAAGADWTRVLTPDSIAAFRRPSDAGLHL